MFEYFHELLYAFYWVQINAVTRRVRCNIGRDKFFLRYALSSNIKLLPFNSSRFSYYRNLLQCTMRNIRKVSVFKHDVSVYPRGLVPLRMCIRNRWISTSYVFYSFIPETMDIDNSIAFLTKWMKTIREKYILFCIYIFILYLTSIVLLGKDLHKFVTFKFKLNV